MISLERLRCSPLLLMTRPAGKTGAGIRSDLAAAADRTAQRVAIVEDELMVAWSIEAMLESLGHVVVGTFANGEDAVEALSDQLVDLVCVDINLGRGIDGIETARRIMRTQPAAFLFITAYSDDATRSRVNETIPGAVLLGKPVAPVALEHAIRQMNRSTH